MTMIREYAGPAPFYTAHCDVCDWESETFDREREASVAGAQHVALDHYEPPEWGAVND